MRVITLKYPGECRKCGARLDAGGQALYERKTGVFCGGCAPTDPEEIRAYRQEGADRKADRLDVWAEKREERAAAALNSKPELRHDWAFATQPGNIPERTRMNRADARANESLSKAASMRARANAMRNVRVAGDAERARQAERERADVMIGKGSRVEDFAFGSGVVVQVCKKSFRVKFDRSGSTYARDKSFIRLA